MMAGLFGNDPTGIGYTPGNIDLATQQADIQRRRAMAQALMGQSLNMPLEMAGPIAVRRSPLEALARMLSIGINASNLKGMGAEEQDLIQRKQQAASDAVQQLMGATQPTPGTPTTVTEEPGPPTAQGDISTSVQPGQAPSFDTGKFGTAYGKAQYAGVDPALMGSMLSQFNRNQMLARMGMGDMVPGWNQGGGQPSLTPGDANHGAVMSIPQGAAMPGGSAPGAASGGSGMMGVPKSAIAMMLTGDPALGKLGSEIAERTRPANVREGGSIVQYDAQGNPQTVLTAPKLPEGSRMNPQGQIEPIPGYLPTKTAAMTAEEAVKAGFQQVTMKNSNGSETQGFINAQGQFVPRAVAGQAGPAAPAAGGIASMVPTSDAEAKGLGLFLDAKGLRANYVQGPNGQFSLGPGHGQPIAAAPTTPSAPVMGTSQSTESKAEAEGAGKIFADQAKAIDDAATASQNTLARAQEMRTQLARFDPNAGAPGRQILAQWADAAGMSPDKVSKIAGGNLAAMQEFGKNAAQNAFETVRQSLGPGQRITQQEMLLNYKNSANPAMTREAIGAILDYQQGASQWAVDRQQAKDAWVGAKGTLKGFEGNWNQTHPLTSYVPSAKVLSAALSGQTGAPANPPGQRGATASWGDTAPAVDALVAKYAK